VPESPPESPPEPDLDGAGPGRHRRRHRLRLVAPAVAVAVVQVVGSRAFAQAWMLPAEPFAAFLPVLLAGPAALLLRRSHPHVAQGVAGAAVLVWTGVVGAGGPVWLSTAVAAASAVVGSPPGRAGLVQRRRAYALLGGTWAAAWLLLPAWLPVFAPWSSVLGSLAWLLVVVAVAEAARSRRAAAADRRLRAEQERRRRASDERLAVARELHDVIGHSLSMITVQSGVALELMDRRPEVAREALTAIRAASRDALVEVHGVLASLRSSDDEPLRAPRAPAPALADVDALLARARGAGLPVTADVEGDLRGLPVAVDLAAVRVVQEALTNAARHAPGSGARVLLRRSEAELLVRVDDDGTTSPVPPAVTPPTGGGGLLGMRERARALGGRLDAGPRPGGGWRVEGVLPL